SICCILPPPHFGVRQPCCRFYTQSHSTQTATSHPLHHEVPMNNSPIPEGLTFDDVLLQPGRSSILPTDVDTTTNFARKLTINIPLASAAMDTVTESRLAIGIARQGGIGIIHRNLSLDRQAEEVDRVKRSESGMIVDPVTISPDITIRQAL